MKICIIYHSETGNTRHIAQHIASVTTDSRLVEVTDRKRYFALTRFLMQCNAARSEGKTEIEPSHLDVREYRPTGIRISGLGFQTDASNSYDD